LEPIPATELVRYTIDTDPDSERDIARYVEIEARGEQVQHVERIKTAVVLGIKHVVWDVITDQDRYWVLTDLTNLYQKKYFPTVDFVLSFHVGLMMRIRDRPYGDRADEPSAFDELFRRQEQARTRLHDAVEVEDFQAIGMLLRECLLSLVSTTRDRVTLNQSDHLPKGGDFVGWTDMLYGSLCPGSSNKALRQHLKNTADETWQLVNWLTHSRSATSSATLIALEASDTIIGHTVGLLERYRTAGVESCPTCQSRDVRSHFDPDIPPDGDYYLRCGHCDWSSHPQGEDEDSA